MVNIQAWTEEFAAKLREAFGLRLKFAGYQGSYGRGEATAASDIDIVTVLDQVTTGDLERYRALVRTMPQSELACGFLCGVQELAGWPKFDLLGLVLDTRPVWGSLHSLVPALDRQDAWDALKIGASGLYHAACHAYLYRQDPQTALPELGKSAFFCLRLASYLSSGNYLGAKRDLLPVLDDIEQKLLLLSLEPERIPAFTEEEVRAVYSLLLEWSGGVLRTGEKKYGKQGATGLTVGGNK